jgi:predicted nucleic acid-binding protein
MKAFADAVYFIALLSTRDRWHARAIAINRQPPGLLVTTEWVLTEVGDAFSQPGARQQFIRLLDLSIYQRSIPTRYGLLLRATR